MVATCPQWRMAVLYQILLGIINYVLIKTERNKLKQNLAQKKKI